MMLPTHPEFRASSSQSTLKKNKCFYFCTKLGNRLLLCREFELFVLKSQAGHPPRRFPTCCATPGHTLHAGHQHRHLSAPMICDLSDKRCLEPLFTAWCHFWLCVFQLLLLGALSLPIQIKGCTNTNKSVSCAL